MRVIYWVFSAYASVMIGLGIFAWEQTRTIDEFSKLLAAYSAPTTAALAAVIAFINVVRQPDIERLKSELSKQLEETKKDLAAQLEDVKIRLAAKSRAFDDLAKAMDVSYYSVSKIEQGIYSETVALAADDALDLVTYAVKRLDPKHQELFNIYRQRFRFIRESFLNKSQRERLALWQEHGKSLAKPLNEFQDKYADADSTKNTS